MVTGMTPPKIRYAAALFVLSFAVNLLYAWITPHYEVLDEYRHYPVIQHMAANGLTLPPQNVNNPAVWVQEGSQPPAYYLLAALLTVGIDQSDMADVRRENPFVRFDMYPPDTSTLNLTVRHPDSSLDGAFLATRIARIFSAFLGALTVVVTYFTAHALFPEQKLIVYGAPVFNAFLPMFAFISGSVNNDNLSNLCGNLIILLLIRILLSVTPPRPRDYIFLGLSVGVGLLSKLSLGFAIPLVAIVLIGRALHTRSMRPFYGAVAAGAVTIAVAGWWYLQNWQLYGDPTGLSVFTALVGERIVPIGWEGLLAELPGFNDTFWGVFGAITVPPPAAFRTITNIVTIFGLIGVALWWFIHLGSRVRRDSWPTRRWLAAILSGTWILITLAACVRWTLTTPATQGRLAFIALSAISVWLLVGLTWLLPARAARIVVIGGLAALGFSAVTMPFTIIAPAYALPPQAASGDILTSWREPDGTGEILLTALEPAAPAAESGTFITPSATFEIAAPLSRDYALFLHAVDTSGVIIAQREVYPGRGLMLLTGQPVGRIWENPVSVLLSSRMATPDTLDLRIGWYDPQTNTRLILPDGSETYSLGSVDITPRVSADGIPNPLDVTFGDGIRLLGYDISTLGIAAGESVDLTLYWQTDTPIDRDYTMTVQLLYPQNEAKAGSYDGTPQQGSRPTSTWQVGERLTERITLNIAPDALEGPIELRVGWYTQEGEGIFVPLGVQPDYTPMLTLTPMRVLAP